MARTTVNVSSTGRFQMTAFTSATVVAGNTVDGMSMFNDGATMLWIDNNSGLAQSIDVYIEQSVDFAVPSPVNIPVSAAGVVNFIGPFPTHLYGNHLLFDVSSASMDFAGFSLL